MENSGYDSRRDFLRKIGIGGAMAALGAVPAVSLAADAASKKKSPKGLQLNLGLQEGVAPGQTLTEKLDFMEANGVYGLEIGGGKLAGRVTEIPFVQVSRDGLSPPVRPTGSFVSTARRRSLKLQAPWALTE